jgi:cytosine/adenosine deaminase-related metal-dependent hydrolase
MTFNGRVHYAGSPDGLNPELVDQAQVLHRPDCLILPAMVNAHTHLELTDVGPRSYDPAGGFVGWVKSVRASEPANEVALIASAKQGAQMCLDAGVQAIGDITRCEAVAKQVSETELWGFSYRELFGMGHPYDDLALTVIDQHHESPFSLNGLLRVGLQPHAPYSAGDSVFEAASKPTVRCSTHLAETQEENEFVKHLSGPILKYLKSLGRWDDSFAGRLGQGLSPVQWMRPYLEASNLPDRAYGNWLVAHCNYVDDDDIALLSETRTSVAYCPIASEYFGHKNHRYREMLAAGVNVCLGTDSIVCATPGDLQPLGLISAMRRLYLRDETDPDLLLAMATTHGALALLMEPTVASFQQKGFARFVCIRIDPDSPIDPLIQALTRQDPVEAISLDT